MHRLHMDRRRFVRLGAALSAGVAIGGSAGATQSFSFPSIDGGTLALSDWLGQPVLVVNTASLCGFTTQYDALQRLQDAYAGRAVVLAIPSDDFQQELSTEAEIVEFCDLMFGLTLPMTTIQSVRGAGAHPFYRWMAGTHGFVPQWNFNKVLLDASGQPVGTWGSSADPMGRRIRGALDRSLTA